MAITALDPHTALVVIDLQAGVIEAVRDLPVADVIACASALTEAFRRRSLPVVLVNVAGSAPGRTDRGPRRPDFPAGWTDLITQIHPQPSDHFITKHTPGAFTATGLEFHLRKLGVTQLVIIGIATSNGVEATARQAFELGFNVTLATDAMLDQSTQAHLNSVARVFPKLAETGTTQEVIAMLERTHSLV